jgi:uncharacterized membrane protein YedE/YeeE
MKALTAAVAGLLFGFGLSWSGMVDPARVVGFLDVSGRWDPTLAFVMGSAVLTTSSIYWFARRLRAPLLAPCFVLPTKTRVDRDLLVGAAIFGVGWGISGLCPGPALANLVRPSGPLGLFIVGMLAGAWLDRRLRAATDAIRTGENSDHAQAQPS